MSTLENVVDIADQSFSTAEGTPDDLRSYFEDAYEPRLFNPLDDTEATGRLLELRDQWRGQDATVVFTSGVFDVMHANHRAYLLATKLSAVPAHFVRTEGGGDMNSWVGLDKDTRRNYAAHALGSGLIRQIVSVDGDAAVAERKGFSADKGNMARPIYGWDSRARDTLSAAVPLPGNNTAHILADAVTLHDRAEPSLQGGLHAGIMDVGLGLQPDVWAIYHESEDIIGWLAADRQGQNRGANISPVIIRHSDGVYQDSKLGGPFSTTALARRISGTGPINKVA